MSLPKGPFAIDNSRKGDILVVVVDGGLKSELIDSQSGEYGYYHVAVDCGEVDKPSGRKVIVDGVQNGGIHRVYLDNYKDEKYVRIPCVNFGFQADKYCRQVRSLIGSSYDLTSILFGQMGDDPDQHVCSDLVRMFLSPRVVARIRDLSDSDLKDMVWPNENGVFMTPNAVAKFGGAPHGSNVNTAEHKIPAKALNITTPPPSPIKPTARVVVSLARIDYRPGSADIGNDWKYNIYVTCFAMDQIRYAEKEQEVGHSRVIQDTVIDKTMAVTKGAVTVSYLLEPREVDTFDDDYTQFRCVRKYPLGTQQIETISVKVWEGAEPGASPPSDESKIAIVDFVFDVTVESTD